MRIQTVSILILTIAGFSLRFYFLTSSHPFFDEYTTVLAARQILRQGWPVLPSGLFYEHGLLATYLIAPFTALFIDLPPDQWQPAHWGLMLSRWPSVLLGTITIPFIYSLSRRGRLGVGPAVLAAGLFALSPEGMVWGGRARMYALATLLTLLTVYWAYRGASYPAPARFRWLALAALLATLLTQFGAMTLAPPLLAGMFVVGWLSWRGRPTRPWFLRRSILGEGFALVAVLGLAVGVKRLGRPLGVAEWGTAGVQTNPLVDLFNTTIAYQTTLHFSWADTVRFLARQFGVPHHFWLTVLALLGVITGVLFWLLGRPGKSRIAVGQHPASNSYFNLFLWLVFGLIVVEMVTLLEPFRRNPRYLVMYLPLFYLIAARAIFNLFPLFQSVVPHFSLSASRASLLSLALLAFFTFIGFNDLKVALLTPEPAYEEAFAWLEAKRQPGDVLLTMNTPAAALYLGQADGFTVQEDAGQFLLNVDTDPVDRWLGVPWLDSAADFNSVLNTTDRTWFVIDTIRQPVYFRGDWLAVVNDQMEQVWAKDNALIYRTRADRTPLPSRPDTLVKATLGETVELTGYSLQFSDPQSSVSNLKLILYWRPLTELPVDYTVFIHLRDLEGTTVAQRDGQPLEGAYPTSRWQPGETVIDPITLSLPENLPSGRYTLLAGLYRLDTLERLTVSNDATGENAVVLGEVDLP